MELRQLEYFIAIVDLGTITGAARALNMSQPPLSAQMHALEGELGCALCDMRDQFLAARDLRGLLCVDGIHPNASGYGLISNYAIKRLNEVYDVVI